MPWKNGLGETLEIHLAEDADGVRFRISQAVVVEDGVFSDFSGLHRTLVLLSGNGMKLSHKTELNAQTENTLKSPLDMALFSGGAQTVATLTDGCIEDLNIMVRETDTKAKVIPFFAPHTIEITNNETILFAGFYTNQDCVLSIKEEAFNAELLTVEAQSFVYFNANNIMTLVSGSGVFIQVFTQS